MTDLTLYDTLYTLPELSFIAGTDKLLEFTAYQEDGVNLLNITGGNIKWLLSRYGEYSQSVLEISGTITDANHFEVSISSTDTSGLSGKYIQQLVITDFYGNTFRPGQGIVLISPAIPLS